MATEKKEKKEALGTKINLSSIVKKAEQKRELALGNSPATEQKKEKQTKSKNVTITIAVSKDLWNEYRELYYNLMKELGNNYVYLSRGEVFVQLVKFMDSSINIDISDHKELYDNYIGAKGRRFNNERTIPDGTEVITYRWGEFTPEQMQTFKKLLTKLAVQTGLGRIGDFSKQYFMVDIIDFFKNNIIELSEYIRSAKNEK